MVGVGYPAYGEESVREVWKSYGIDAKPTNYGMSCTVGKSAQGMHFVIWKWMNIHSYN